MSLSWRRRRKPWPTFLLLLAIAISARSLITIAAATASRPSPIAMATPSTFCVHHQHSTSRIRHAIRPCPERSHKRRDSQPQQESEAKMVINYTCHASNDDECAKVQSLLAKASEIITSVLKFETPVHVNASYLPFCQKLGQCQDSSGTVSTGQAYPSVSYLMQEENSIRMYPQALLKQYTNLSAQVDWYEYDMNAQFNSEIDWYFEDDANSIDKDKTDLLLTIIHELIHGLGFVSAWSDDTHERFSIYDPEMKKFLTPMPLDPPNELPDVSAAVNSESGVQPFWGFVDFPLDKFFYAHNKVHLAGVTKLLNQWGDGNVMFATILDMVNAWVGDTNFREQAEKLYRSATTRGDITIVIDDEQVMVMETSLAPFQDGSSLTHADESAYASTADYLMCYSAMRGVSLADLSKIHKLGPIGPSLVRIMAAMGYHIQSSYNNGSIPQTVQSNITFWVPPIDLVGTSTNPSPAVSVNANGPAHIPSASATPSSSSSLLSACCTELPLLLCLFSTFVFFSVSNSHSSLAPLIP
ncbi:hypothetical protein BDB00DRAFT_951721 [Zychaea mexicana]|uniref:uncharacterized protein n=1 Tax=Zychaea mexicana TaxID=64656 RepID=UPI0022FE061B|nr:uncharacterized protein BDB00DRAFT_951721 [Zychaea mexicana]KAI9497547.1 hypothetical protein BDB00DRAFT_951721 [Zychaea mexicana]